MFLSGLNYIIARNYDEDIYNRNGQIHLMYYENVYSLSYHFYIYRSEYGSCGCLSFLLIFLSVEQ